MKKSQRLMAPVRIPVYRSDMGLWNYLTSEALAPVFGFISFVVAAIGFPVTCWQAWRAKDEAAKANKAATEAKLRMNSFSAMRETEAAYVAVANITDAIGQSDWQRALQSYHDLSGSLTELSECNIKFDNDIAGDLIASFQKIDENCSTIERHMIAGKKGQLVPSKQIGALRPLKRLIVQVKFNLERLAA